MHAVYVYCACSVLNAYCNKVDRVQMGGVSGRPVQFSDSPMLASSGYKCSVDATVVYGLNFSLCIKDQGFYPGLLQRSG